MNCHHNYVQKETNAGREVDLTRKGAVRAGKDELDIIPGSMAAESCIVRGLGNADSLESCSAQQHHAQAAPRGRGARGMSEGPGRDR